MPTTTTASSQTSLPQASSSPIPQNNFFPMQNMSSTYYYPYYYPPAVGYSMPTTNLPLQSQSQQMPQLQQQQQQQMPPQQQQQLYNQMIANMNNPAFMSQFAQFMSMMNGGLQSPAQPPSTVSLLDPLSLSQGIEGQKFPPPASYTCRRCKQKGHWIQFCPLNKKSSFSQFLSRHSSSSFVSQTPKIECTTCKKWFISEAKKQEHLALHEKCPYPGCTFAAIEKVLREHIAIHHHIAQDKVPPSLLELIPEKYSLLAVFSVDIATQPPSETPPRKFASGIGASLPIRWREERKRRYPTQKNIEEKQNALQAVEKAGGLVESSDKRVQSAGSSAISSMTPSTIFFQVAVWRWCDVGETRGIMQRILKGTLSERTEMSIST